MGGTLRKAFSSSASSKTKAPPVSPAEMPQERELTPTDPRLPLNAREVYRLTASWRTIKRNMEAAGVEMFVSFFKTHDDMMEKFSKFKELSLDDSLYDNDLLAGHGALVMGALDRAISNLHDVDQALAMCKQVGESHQRISGFKQSLFKKMEQPFLNAVKITLGDRYNEQMDRIYSTMTAFLISEIAKGFASQNTEEQKCFENDTEQKTMVYTKDVVNDGNSVPHTQSVINNNVRSQDSTVNKDFVSNNKDVSPKSTNILQD